MAAAIAVACTGTSATTTTTTSTAPSTTTTTIPSEQALNLFATCLDDRGVAVEDIEVDEQGRPDLSPLALANDVGGAAFRAALDDCAPLLAANGLLDLSTNPELAAAVRRQLVAYAACMRKAGVEDFPNPPEDFDGRQPPFPPESIPRTDPELEGAIEHCGTELGLAPITG